MSTSPSLIPTDSPVQPLSAFEWLAPLHNKKPEDYNLNPEHFKIANKWYFHGVQEVWNNGIYIKQIPETVYDMLVLFHMQMVQEQRFLTVPQGYFYWFQDLNERQRHLADRDFPSEFLCIALSSATENLTDYVRQEHYQKYPDYGFDWSLYPRAQKQTQLAFDWEMACVTLIGEIMHEDIKLFSSHDYEDTTLTAYDVIQAAWFFRYSQDYTKLPFYHMTTAAHEWSDASTERQQVREQILALYSYRIYMLEVMIARWKPHCTDL